MDITKIRAFTLMMAPGADFDAAYVFYYDETNNMRKFYVREAGFNSAYTANFVLGGLVHHGPAPDVQPLISSFALQKTVKEVKFKHIASGDFLDCLKSEKLLLFQDFVLRQENLYVHYSSLNIFYWSLVDIVDSAIAGSKAEDRYNLWLVNRLKNDLYKLCRLEIKAVTDLFYRYQYPNIKKESLQQFVEELTSLFDPYIDQKEFHFGLQILRRLLNEAQDQGTLAFIMDEEDHTLIENLSQFYFRPVYLFVNSTHIFDNEDTISYLFPQIRFINEGEAISNYSFVDSQSNPLVQLSDVFVGIMGKLFQYLNMHDRGAIETDFGALNNIQQANIDLLIDLMDKSDDENKGFFHHVDSREEMTKMNVIRRVRGK